MQRQFRRVGVGVCPIRRIESFGYDRRVELPKLQDGVSFNTVLEKGDAMGLSPPRLDDVPLERLAVLVVAYVRMIMRERTFWRDTSLSQ